MELARRNPAPEAGEIHTEQEYESKQKSSFERVPTTEGERVLTPTGSSQVHRSQKGVRQSWRKGWKERPSSSWDDRQCQEEECTKGTTKESRKDSGAVDTAKDPRERDYSIEVKMNYVESEYHFDT